MFQDETAPTPQPKSLAWPCVSQDTNAAQRATLLSCIVYIGSRAVCFARYTTTAQSTSSRFSAFLKVKTLKRSAPFPVRRIVSDKKVHHDDQVRCCCAQRVLVPETTAKLCPSIHERTKGRTTIPHTTNQRDAGKWQARINTGRERQTPGESNRATAASAQQLRKTKLDYCGTPLPWYHPIVLVLLCE